ncbi:MAG: Rho-binding antiterminator [Paraglaciecola sp.]|uniref:Rho-binding antiterminator n=1 Tax=Paraglaciecola sp. TaxID=1920173 RepID=UPI003263BC6F
MISCEYYDYIEVACMYGYTIRLTLKSGASVLGTAVDTSRNEQSDECIKMKVDDNHMLVTLNSITTMHVLDNYAQFKVVNFK